MITSRILKTLIVKIIIVIILLFIYSVTVARIPPPQCNSLTYEGFDWENYPFICYCFIFTLEDENYIYFVEKQGKLYFVCQVWSRVLPDEGKKEVSLICIHKQYKIHFVFLYSFIRCGIRTRFQSASWCRVFCIKLASISY